jgi:hypothetical protein
MRKESTVLLLDMHILFFPHFHALSNFESGKKLCQIAGCNEVKENYS